jgi:mono/diheme cytochrome c family protein
MAVGLNRRRIGVVLPRFLVALLLTAVLGGDPVHGQGQGASGGSQGERTRVFLGLGAAPDEAAAQRGEPLYKQFCMSCHGPEGRGAQGPNLLRSPIVLHDEKGEQIGPIVRSGRSGTPGMPAQPDVTDAQLYDLSQYIHLQVELTANRGTYEETYASLRSQVTGNAQRGEAFFKGSGGCTNCHSATGDLASIGARFPRIATLKSRFLWPSTPGSTKATVTTRAGETVTGTVKRITDFEISLIDSVGAYHSWSRSEVTVKVEDKLAGHRALLPKYSDADIADLAAYLVDLR